MRFRHTTDENGNDIYTLWPEKTYEDGWVAGWCPELNRTMIVHPANIVAESIRSTGEETPAKQHNEAPTGLEPVFQSAELKADT